MLLLFAAYTLLGAFLLLRPHQDTFIGLDSSAIRMMTHAMDQGRAQVGIDQTLADAPDYLRQFFLYIPSLHQRITRDRSFQLDNLETCSYRPWFYPFLSYAAIGFSAVVPGSSPDIFLPALALAFFLAAGWFMLSRSGANGLIAGFAILMGMPLFFWFSRGYYPELAGLLSVFLAALYWLNSEDISQKLYPIAFFLGLSVCFHPLIALWAGVILLFTVSNAGLKTRQVALAFLAFFLGMLPLVLITRWITQPYGEIFSFHWLNIVFQSSTLYFVFLLGAFVAAGCMTIVLAHRGRFLLQSLFFWPTTTAHVLRLFIAALPTGLLLLFDKTRNATFAGFTDLWSLLNGPFGIIVIATILASLLPCIRPRARALLIMTVALASIFLYLKGIEPFGLWSQRRLLPITIPFLVAALAIWRDVLLSLTSSPWKPRIVSSALFVLAAMLVYQQPEFYLLRSEHGADTVVGKLQDMTNTTLAIFDYHQYGSPLAALGQAEVLALSNRINESDRARVIQWAANEAKLRPVLWITAFDNPGVEHDVHLEQRQTIQHDLSRLHAKKVFPAEIRDHKLTMRILAMRPLDADTPPPLDKILGRGFLAMRGPWGRADISLLRPDNEKLPARWTREGSAIIGPVPEPGQSVLVELTAGAYRSGEKDHQVMIISPPWQGPSLELRVENSHTLVRGILHRPEQAQSFQMPTGQYTFTSRYPYDPETEGIHGFEPDLGVLLHRVRIQTVSNEQ